MHSTAAGYAPLAGGGGVTTPIGGKEDQLARPAGTGAPQALHRALVVAGIEPEAAGRGKLGAPASFSSARTSRHR